MSNIPRLSTSANGLGLPSAERPFATASRAMGSRPRHSLVRRGDRCFGHGCAASRPVISMGMKSTRALPLARGREEAREPLPRGAGQFATAIGPSTVLSDTRHRNGSRRASRRTAEKCPE